MNIHDNNVHAQHKRILDGLRHFGSMTTYDIERELNISRVATRIFELRQQGHPIKKHLEQVIDSFGRKHGRVARYWIASSTEVAA